MMDALFSLFFPHPTFLTGSRKYRSTEREQRRKTAPPYFSSSQVGILPRGWNRPPQTLFRDFWVYRWPREDGSMIRYDQLDDFIDSSRSHHVIR